MNESWRYPEGWYTMAPQERINLLAKAGYTENLEWYSHQDWYLLPPKMRSNLKFHILNLYWF